MMKLHLKQVEVNRFNGCCKLRPCSCPATRINSDDDVDTNAERHQ